MSKGSMEPVREITGEMQEARTTKGSMEPVRNMAGEMEETRTISGKLTIPPTRTIAPRYPDVTDKPSINGVTIEGNKLSEDYHLQEKMDFATVAEIERILYLDV